MITPTIRVRLQQYSKQSAMAGRNAESLLSFNRTAIQEHVIGSWILPRFYHRWTYCSCWISILPGKNHLPVLIADRFAAQYVCVVRLIHYLLNNARTCLK